VIARALNAVRCKAGAPLRVELRSEWAPEGLPSQCLLPALSSGCIVSVEFHDSLMATSPFVQTLVTGALARSRSTLTALHGLRLIEEAGVHKPDLGAFTTLRELTLCHWRDTSGTLLAAQLPSSLEELRVEEHTRPRKHTRALPLPDLFAFDRLHRLRRLTFVDHKLWQLFGCDNDGELTPALLPRSLEVCTVLPAQNV